MVGTIVAFGGGTMTGAATVGGGGTACIIRDLTAIPFSVCRGDGIVDEEMGGRSVGEPSASVSSAVTRWFDRMLVSDALGLV